MGHRDLKTLNVFRFARSLGKKHVQQTMMWSPTAATYGLCAAILVVYYTDWKVVGRYIPYYGSRKVFKDAESSE